MADVVKADLQATHDRLRQLDLYFLEVLARAAAAGAPSTVLTVATLADVAKVITQSVMDLETWLPPS